MHEGGREIKSHGIIIKRGNCWSAGREPRSCLSCITVVDVGMFTTESPGPPPPPLLSPTLCITVPDVPA